LDANTRKPIARASVYINGSSIGTSCDDEGAFFLRGFPKPPYKISVSAIGYETNIEGISQTSDLNAITILLKPKTLQLSETVIKSPEKDGWELYGDQFIVDFIGYSDFAKQCKVRNPEVLSFLYDENELVLRVYAEQPLIVENRALGYKITYWLDDFTKDYRARTVFFKGASQFEDLITDKTSKRKVRRWQANRTSAYRGSIYHFMTSLYNNRTIDEGFEVRTLLRMEETAAFEHADKRHDTIRFDANNIDTLEAFFREKYVAMESFDRPNNVQSDTNVLRAIASIGGTRRLYANEMAKRCMQRLQQWYDTADVKIVGRFTFLNPKTIDFNKQEIVEFRKDTLNPGFIIRSQYVAETAQLKRNDMLIVSRTKRNGKYDVLGGIVKCDTLIRTTLGSEKMLAFENYLYIIYKNEMEEELYRKAANPFKPFRKFLQTSIISLHEVDEVAIYTNGCFEPPYGIFIEQYWSYEKLDKLLPLDYSSQ
jgi:hypothetical protein